MKIAGIYIDKTCTINDATEFALHICNSQLYWSYKYNEIYDLYEDVELGGEHNVIELPQCTFGINKNKKEWYIKDNTNNSIICKGKYVNNNVEKQVSKFIKQMTGK